MRPRRSIFGPLLLIGIGILFLMNNVIPDVPIFELISRYWPFLLIAWGALRLIEVLFWAATSKPVPAVGVGGGEWFTVVLICLIGSGLFAIHRFRDRFPSAKITSRGLEVFGESYDYPIEAERQTSRNPKIVIESFRGNARITGADTSNVKVTGRKTVRAYQRGDADDANKQTPVEVVSMGDQVLIRTNQDRVSGNRRASADLEIVVPKGASIEARGRMGDFDITEINGNVDIASDNAGVRLQNISGGVRIDLRRSDVIRLVNVKGNVDMRGRGQDVELENIEGQVTVNGNYSGELQFRALAKPLRFESSQTEFRVDRIPGNVRIGLGNINATNIVGPTFLSTKTRDVQFHDFAGSLEVSLERGDVELRPGRNLSGKVDVHTRSGDIDLAVLPGSKFELKGTTERGDVTNDFGQPLTTLSEGHTSTVKGSTGAGGASITLDTQRGSVTVRKAGADQTGPVTNPSTPSMPKPPSAPKPPVPSVPPKAIE